VDLSGRLLRERMPLTAPVSDAGALREIRHRGVDRRGREAAA
jgi:hypothetical protein